MSGWQSRYGVPLYDLTYTKAAYWHRFCQCGLVDSATDFLLALYAVHLEPVGFGRAYSSSAQVLALTWQYDAVGSRQEESRLYDAVAYPPKS